MKFCPQCGTTFEPGARFCLECGFDKSSVETTDEISVSTPEALVDKPSVSTGDQYESQFSKPENNPVCPECGTELTPSDRFCLECGFDTSSTDAAKPVASKNPVPDENIPPEVIHTEPSTVKINKQFCPQCGTVLNSDERFCLECGFDTKSIMGDSNAYKSTQGTENQNPVVVTPEVKPTPIPPQTPKPTIAPAPYSVHYQPQEPDNTAEKPNQLNKDHTKKPWLMILLVVIGVGVLGAGGWFAYNKFLTSPTQTTVDSNNISETPEITNTDTPEPEAEIVVAPTESTPEKPKPVAKPKSKIDQELEKYREQEKNKAAQQNNTSQQAKSNPGVKVTPAAGGNPVVSKVIHEVGRKEDPKNTKPKNPAKFNLQQSTMIVRITTDHYNDGMGTSAAGNITIKDRNGKTLGTYKASGRTGKNGAPNAKWVAEPNLMLEKGTYYIWDSDFSTWSKNFVGNGFVVVEGYELE